MLRVCEMTLGVDGVECCEYEWRPLLRTGWSDMGVGGGSWRGRGGVLRVSVETLDMDGSE